MIIKDISMKIEEMVDGRMGLCLRAKADNCEDGMEMGAAHLWSEDKSPKEAADILRVLARAVERMGESRHDA